MTSISTTTRHSNCTWLRLPECERGTVGGHGCIFEAVGRLADGGLELIDYGEADDEGGLALAFGKGEQVELVLVCGAWMVSDWEPEEEGREA